MKIKDLFEFGVGRITKQNQTKDVGPNEIKKQAAKFGFKVDKDGYPPVLHKTAAKNSTPNKLMNLGINEAEDPKTLKKAIISTVNQTNDAMLLQKVLDTLQTNNFDKKLLDILSKDTDTKKYMNAIADIVLSTKGTVAEKQNFIDNFSKGFIDTKKMLSGKYYTLNEIVKDEFAYRVFLRMSALKETGVGPGEIALGVLSPNIKWVGQKGGGGDINVNGVKVEVKGKLEAGGRWFDARKASRDEHAIANAFKKYKIELPSYFNVDRWIEIRDTIKDKKIIQELATVMAKSNFKFAKTNKLISALASKDSSEIKKEFLETGYENYQKYNGFDGMLLLDVGSGNALQYFTSYADMKDSISVGTPYLYSPASDAMPKVTLKIAASAATPSKKASAAKIDVSPEIDKTKPLKRKPSDVTAAKPRLAQNPKGVGRSKR